MKTHSRTQASSVVTYYKKHPRARTVRSETITLTRMLLRLRPGWRGAPLKGHWDSFSFKKVDFAFFVAEHCVTEK